MNMNISPSRAETYYRCPFSYYCRYGLKLQENKSATFDPLQKGTVIHFVLEQLLSEFSAQELSELDPDERYEKYADIWTLISNASSTARRGQRDSSIYMNASRAA